MISKREQEMLATISGKEARNNVSQLIIPMERWAGSDAETEGAKKVRDKLAPYVDTCEQADGFANRFVVIDDAIAKLRDARNIVEVEGDLDRARAVLITIANAATYIDWSEEVTSPVRIPGTSDRLPPYWLDLRDVFTAIDSKESPESVLSKIKSKLEEALSITEGWGTGYEKFLQGL